jgi:hypothetical protein
VFIYTIDNLLEISTIPIHTIAPKRLNNISNGLNVLRGISAWMSSKIIEAPKTIIANNINSLLPSMVFALILPNK